MKKFIAIIYSDQFHIYETSALDILNATAYFKNIIYNQIEYQFINSVIVYEINNKYEIDIKRWISEFDYVNNQIEEEKLKAKELAEYERIKSKYNL